MHILVCFAVECETMCSQSCASGRCLSVLSMGGHDGADVIYSFASKVIVLRDMIDRIVDHLKWIEKLVCA
jgi:hypothetical protein